LERRHDRLPSHGSGRDRTEEEWRSLADRFVESGLVDVEQEHNTLQITDSGRRALEGEPVLVVMEQPEAGHASPKVQSVVVGAHDPLLFESLRLLRRRLADEAGVPAFVVFSDRSLIAMAAAFPHTAEDFRRVHGVGERKAEAYGDLFLAEILKHVREQAPEGDRAAVPAPGW
jgi:ATP-dependent DNA helicase RecQ